MEKIVHTKGIFWSEYIILLPWMFITILCSPRCLIEKIWSLFFSCKRSWIQNKFDVFADLMKLKYFLRYKAAIKKKVLEIIGKVNVASNAWIYWVNELMIFKSNKIIKKQYIWMKYFRIIDKSIGLLNRLFGIRVIIY